MNKLTLSVLSLLFTFQALAQAPVKRYVMLEHFTNSRCVICASRQPTFYNTINNHPNDIHHISIHPPVPYTNCVFYQANTIENAAWANYYNIQGTPRVALNGTLLPGSNPLLPNNTLQNALGQTSNLYVQVTEDTLSGNREGMVRLETKGPIPAGNYKLFVALAEKTVNYNAPNGVNVHHDVFRNMITPIDGVDYTPAPLGEAVEFSFNYSISPNWVAEEIYALAFVRNMDNGEILNSGTRFDPIVLSTQTPVLGQVQVTPNPVGNTAQIFLPAGVVAEDLEIYSLNGTVVIREFSQQQQRINLETASLPRGVYLLRVTTASGVYTGKFIR